MSHLSGLRKELLLVLILGVGGCLLYTNKHHPLESIACHAAESIGISVYRATAVEIPWLPRYTVFRLWLDPTLLDAYNPSPYVAVRPGHGSILLESVEDINALLAAESIVIHTDTIALQVSMLMYCIRNATWEHEYMVLRSAHEIPGHDKQLSRDNLAHARSLREIVEDPPWPDSIRQLLSAMMDRYDGIYVTRIIDIDDSVAAPTVVMADSSYRVQFSVWERKGGVVSQWKVSLTREKGITGFLERPLAIYVGDSDGHPDSRLVDEWHTAE